MELLTDYKMSKKLKVAQTCFSTYICIQLYFMLKQWGLILLQLCSETRDAVWWTNHSLHLLLMGLWIIMLRCTKLTVMGLIGKTWGCSRSGLWLVDGGKSCVLCCYLCLCLRALKGQFTHPPKQTNKKEQKKNPKINKKTVVLSIQWECCAVVSFLNNKTYKVCRVYRLHFSKKWQIEEDTSQALTH